MTSRINKLFITKLLLIQILCGALSLSLGIYWGISLHLSQYDSKLYDNIIIAGVNVGNLTPEEAITTLETEYLTNILEREVTLKLDKKVFKAPIKSFLESTNLREAIFAAYDYPNHLTLLQKWHFLQNNTEKPFDINLHFKEKRIRSFAETIVSHINQDANDATISVNADNTIVLTPHSDGYIINKKALIDRIKLSLDTYSEAPIDIQDFSVKKSPVRTTSLLQSIDTCIASFNTDFTPNTSRARNIILSTEAINGMLLAPGDTFSFNTAVGETTAEKGYEYAPVIANSRISQGLGGGICQVSTTLYNAILKAGLYPLNRQPHSQPINYVPLGLDATVSWDSIDFQFQNTFEYPLYIKAYVQKDKIYIDIYSNHTLKNKSYKLKTEVLAKGSPAAQRLSANSKNSVQRYRKGYTVKVTREIYEQNTLTGTELISVDTY
ncbi:MAG: vanW 1 [Clostridia bacterium]|jgi:vancomycin resistance protein YoaR|nr:vanW 1 [Clostridia bacterium]